MSRAWELRKQNMQKMLRDFDQRSPVLRLLGYQDRGDEFRALLEFDTETLVREGDGPIVRAGPVVAEVRYLESFLSTCPHPQELLVIHSPRWVFHPNAHAQLGAWCAGHPKAGVALDALIHQFWAGINLNLRLVNTNFGEVLNPEAAEYVRQNVDQFPLSARGLFEAADATPTS